MDELSQKTLSELNKLLNKYQIYYCQECYDLIENYDIIKLCLLYEINSVSYSNIIKHVCGGCENHKDKNITNIINYVNENNNFNIKDIGVNILNHYNDRVIKYKDELRALNYLIQISKEIEDRGNKQ